MAIYGLGTVVIYKQNVLFICGNSAKDIYGHELSCVLLNNFSKQTRKNENLVKMLADHFIWPHIKGIDVTLLTLNT